MYADESGLLPRRQRLPGIVLGTVIMFGAAVSLMSAKTIPITFFAFAVVAVFYQRKRLAWSHFPKSGISISIAALAFYASCTAFWAASASDALTSALLFGVISAIGLSIVNIVVFDVRDNAVHIGEGLWIGLAAGAIYLLIEILSGQAIKIWAYNFFHLGPGDLNPTRYFTWSGSTLVAVHTDDLKRNAFPIPLLIWPSLMAATAVARRARITVIAGLAILSYACVLLGPDQSAKVGLLAGTSIFLISIFSIRAALLATIAGWITACLAVVPAAIGAYALDLQNASWLQLSGRLRIVIWHDIALKVFDAPLFGIGANMTRFVHFSMAQEPVGGAAGIGTEIWHPHNVYLQAWFELGLVGACLLLAIGLALIRAISRLGDQEQKYALALFASGASLLAASYSIWQVWLMCLLWLSSGLFSVSRSILLKRSRPDGL